MFQTTRLTNTDTVELFIDGDACDVPAGISVAAALLLHNRVPFRKSLVDESPRAPYCLMGVCCECLVDVDGVGGRLSCQITVQSGMRVKRSLDD